MATLLWFVKKWNITGWKLIFTSIMDGEIWRWHPVRSCHKYLSQENVSSVTLGEINGRMENGRKEKKNDGKEGKQNVTLEEINGRGMKWIWHFCWLIAEKNISCLKEKWICAKFSLIEWASQVAQSSFYQISPVKMWHTSTKLSKERAISVRIS